MSAEGAASAQKFAAILLGASEFPRFPADRKLDNPSFARSAAAMRALLTEGDAFLLGKPAMLDLFDKEDSPADIVRRIREFLRPMTALTDVFMYYCGHGDFLPVQRYYLSLRTTEEDNERFTGLLWGDTLQALESSFAMRRVYIVLDSCFAGAAVNEFQASAIGSVIEHDIFRTLPRRGKALIAASYRGNVALAPGDQPLTMFTSAFVETVRSGVVNDARSLSLRDVVIEMRRRLPERFGERAVLPEIHDPVQPEGDLSTLEFFRNKGFSPPKKPEATVAERAAFDLAVDELGRPLVKIRLAALDSLGDLLGATKSAAFRGEILDRIAASGAADDSAQVRAKCAELLRQLAPPAGLPVPDQEGADAGRAAFALNSAAPAQHLAPGASNQADDATLGATAPTEAVKSLRQRAFIRLVFREFIFFVAAVLTLICTLHFSPRINARINDLLGSLLDRVLLISLIATTLDFVVQVTPQLRHKNYGSAVVIALFCIFWYFALDQYLIRWS